MHACIHALILSGHLLPHLKLINRGDVIVFWTCFGRGQFTVKRGWCVWITGLPGSGKSTVAGLVQEKLKSSSVNAQTIAIDMIRRYATPRPTYSREERATVYGALIFTAVMLTENSVNVIIDATGNRRRFREQARRSIPQFMEAYLKCSLEVCMQREKKRADTHLAPADIYEKAQKGKAPTVPGVGVPYEEPLNPEIEIDSSKLSAEESAQKIWAAVLQRFVLEPKQL